MCIGLVVGALRHGRLVAIARTRIRRPEFLVVAIAASLFVDLTDTGPSAAIALLGLVSGLAFAVVNVHLAGMTVIAIGIALNLLPIALNGAMPVRPEALVEAEMVTAEELPRVTLNGARELSDDSTILGVLGDTFPVRWTNQVVSIGDLIMMVGLAALVANLTLQRRRPRLHPSALPALEAMGWHEEIDLTNEAGTGVVTIDLREPVDTDETGRDRIDAIEPDAAGVSPPV